MPPLLLVPGFTQTAASWRDVVTALHALDPNVDARALDIPTGRDFDATARALGDAHGAGTWCGYSMGARLVLRLALDAPQLVERLVLVSGTPGIDDAAERAQRVASDETLATRIERDGVDAFLTRWLAQPMFASVPADAPGLDERRALTADHLAEQLRRLGTGSMTPMWDRLGALRMPVLIVHGTRDHKFTDLAQRLAAGIPGARRIGIECGHAVPLERPRELAAVLHEFHKPIATSTASTS